jgi:hypothetical protein
MASRDHRRQATGTPPGSPGEATPPTGTPPLRRRELLGLGVAAGAAATAVVALVPAARAQTPGTTPGSTPGSTPGTAAAKKAGTVEGADLEFVRFARSVELAVGEVYEAALDTGKLKSRATDQARAFHGHHADHAARFVDFAEAEAAKEANPGLLNVLRPRVQGAASEKDLIGVLQSVEESAAATYLSALGEIDDWQLASVAATIAPVDAQHATAWNRLTFEDAGEWAAQIDGVLPVTAGTDGRWDQAQFPVGPA